ncbi:DUF1192 domain-containing protein [Gellertiella hungarica]|uniref:Uncharacterized small protein (DUF1192 family) n=1 Tax=Gellertiella hungarica TaxID=1572859 RepID=A0A7W6J357_9HYPH|nr:DUF1192 domain-containing protein [Gellertiella hungarica]MBB4063141.1 uncharacterized small protein (DUF1192 family) [Gellertiella hungarica]
MSLFDDERPKRKLEHEIGCDLSLLSADELQARIGLLEAEIERLAEEKRKKLSGKAAAESLFRSK